ncbi:MAG: MBL fold metallo-hydrolase [Prevotella sp.]|nr:MBL fold metallo-hydrolase [Prevotella sp.]
MLNIRCFQCNMLQENCYVVNDVTREAVVIDCGAYYEQERQAISDYIRREELTLRHVLCTHGHFDHVFGVDTLYKEFGVGPEIHADDNFLMEGFDDQCIALLGVPYGRQLPPVGHFLIDGEDIGFGTHQLRVLHTPGHSPGGVLFHCAEEKVVFSGDTLFRMSVGRSDLQRGSWTQLMASLTTVVAHLPEDTTVYPGHGPTTTIGLERRMNPYLR